MEHADRPSDASSKIPKPVTVRVQSLSASQPVPMTLPTTEPTTAMPVPMLVQPAPTNVPMMTQEGTSYAEKKPSRLSQYWNKVGGGSFMVSLMIHAGLLVASYFVVETVVTENKVDFLPGGESKGAEEASREVNEVVQVKPQNAMIRRIVSNSLTSSIHLPDELPMDSVDIPVMTSLMGSRSMSSGAFGGAGAGGGLGAGIGTGNVKGFLARTFFGNLGGDGLPGVFYDLKQDRKGKPLSYDANGYFQIVKAFAKNKFDANEMKDYFRAPEQMSFTFLGVPLMKAEEGPKAFAVDQHVQPRGWLVHYSGQITPPELGEWRFVGYFDDMLAVYIDGKPVLDASRDDLVNLGEEKRDDEVRQSFGGMNILNGKCYAGKWVRLTGPAKIDIVVGERPGGQVGGLLLVEHRKTKYKKRENGTPVLPLFTTATPDMEDLERMQQFSEANKAFGLELKNIPVFTLGNNKPSLGGGRMRPSSLDMLQPEQ